MLLRLLLVNSFTVVCIIIACCFPPITVEYQTGSRLESNRAIFDRPSHRNKRFLIFEGSGVLKLVIGFSQPLDLLDRHPYRQLAVSYTFHLQYTPPPRPVYWWTYFVNSTAWSHARASGGQRHPKKLPMSHFNRTTKDQQNSRSNYRHNSHPNHYGTFLPGSYSQPVIVYDKSRFAVYQALETVFNSKGLPGARCLLRTICEISQRPMHEDNAIHEIINAIFRPSVSNVDQKYLRAMRIGTHGLNCENIFWGCKNGTKWLSNYFFNKYV